MAVCTSLLDNAAKAVLVARQGGAVNPATLGHKVLLGWHQLTTGQKTLPVF